ncbi:MAG: hypothetical protein ACK44M_07855 [Chloroflexus sp.]
MVYKDIAYVFADHAHLPMGPRANPASATPQVGYLLVEALAPASPATAMPHNRCFVVVRSG